MKTTISTLIGALLIVTPMVSQNQRKLEKVTVLSIDAKSISQDPFLVGSQVRVELDKLGKFAVTDKFDIISMMEERKLTLEHCYGTHCLVEVGKYLQSDKMFTGSIEDLGKTYAITFRLISVQSSEVEKEYVHEFLKLPDELHNMIRLAVADMFHAEFDSNLMRKLSKKNDFDTENNNPGMERLRLDGPRMGFVTFTGDLRNRITDPKSRGGYDCYPYMFQFGYQFEKQYLNEGKIQALVEFIPMVSGLDQGKFFPSFTLLHGVRSNINGWEVAFGPTVYFLQISSGYYNEYGEWTLENDWKKAHPGVTDNRPEFIERIDRRGNVTLRSAFVIAAGRTFKSGRLNIPVNVFVVPGKSGWRIGCSFGFNARNTNYSH